MFLHLARSGRSFCTFALLVLVGCATPGATPGATAGARPGTVTTRESRIPEYARPQELTGQGHTISEDLIVYRALSRADFRADDPPRYLGGNASEMGAVTCAAIRVRPGAQYEFISTPDRVVVRVLGLVFDALMDRDCSWWNERSLEFSESYVLEHEQIHFGIVEVEARRLTRRANAATALEAPAGTEPDALAEQIQRNIDAELETSKQVVLEESLRFDEATSFGHAPELQRRWRENVERQLEQTPR